MNKMNKSFECDKTSKFSLLQEMQRITPLKKKRFEDFCNKYTSLTKSDVSYEVPLCFNSDSSDESSSDNEYTVGKDEVQKDTQSLTKRMKAAKRKVTAMGKNKKTTKLLKVDPNQQHDQKRVSFGDWSPKDLRKYIEDDMKSNIMHLLVRRNVIRLLNLEFFDDAQKALLKEIERLKPHVSEKELLLYIENRAKLRCFDKSKLGRSKFKSVLIGRAHSTTIEEFYEWNRKLLEKWDYLTQEIDLEDMLVYSKEVLNHHYESACDVCRAIQDKTTKSVE